MKSLVLLIVAAFASVEFSSAATTARPVVGVVRKLCKKTKELAAGECCFQSNSGKCSSSNCKVDTALGWANVNCRQACYLEKIGVRKVASDNSVTYDRQAVENHLNKFEFRETEDRKSMTNVLDNCMKMDFKKKQILTCLHDLLRRTCSTEWVTTTAKPSG